MDIKKKPCKAIGKAKGFQGCGKPQFNRKYGLGVLCNCYSKWLLGTPEGKEVLEKATLKATKPSREFKKFEEEEKRLKSINYLLVNTRNVCHKYIRLRDKGKPCISCGQSYNSNHQAGHYYKAELFSNLKFDEFNISGQCQKCNIFNEGNESEYRVNLPKRIGVEKFNELNRKAKLYKTEDFKWDREKLVEIRNYYRQKIKEL